MPRPTGAAPRGLSFWHPVSLTATWFGVGLLPKAPGTWGSLAALPVAWTLQHNFGPVGLGAAIVMVFAVGCWASSRYARLTGTKDAGEVVIDEVAGQWLVLLLVPPDVLLYALGFVLFRVADIFKPWPVNVADAKIEGGLGVMVDDILAAIYAMAGMAFAQFLMTVPNA